MLHITTFEDLKKICREKDKTIWEISQLRETEVSDRLPSKVREQVKKSIDAMKEAIRTGVKSEEKAISGMCGDDCVRLIRSFEKRPALFGKLYEKIVTYALATSEENLRMGKIVACPTAGSCGIVPSVLVAVSEELELTEPEEINALITAGEVGRIISNKLQPAGAVGGCQAECGLASAMAAAVLTQLRGGTVEQILNSVALALKNLLGLTCDPVCGLVEIPCVKRNPFLAIHAVTASEMALGGVVSKIPPDEVVDAMEQTGKLMSPLLKESSQAGLATTKTAEKLRKKLFPRVLNGE